MNAFFNNPITVTLAIVIVIEIICFIQDKIFHVKR
mgnify:CR=1 FL=1